MFDFYVFFVYRCCWLVISSTSSWSSSIVVLMLSLAVGSTLNFRLPMKKVCAHLHRKIGLDEYATTDLHKLWNWNQLNVNRIDPKFIRIRQFPRWTLCTWMYIGEIKIETLKHWFGDLTEFSFQFKLHAIHTIWYFFVCCWYKLISNTIFIHVPMCAEPFTLLFRFAHQLTPLKYVSKRDKVWQSFILALQMYRAMCMYMCLSIWMCGLRAHWVLPSYRLVCKRDS